MQHTNRYVYLCVMQATDTRERILARMFQDMHKYGFQGLRADKVVADMGITKGALYHYFPGKEAIGLAVIDEILRPAYLQFYQSLATRTDHPIDALQQHLQYLADTATEENISLGCPLNNLAQEMSPISESFRTHLQPVFDGMARAIALSLERGQAAGFVRQNAEPKAVAEFVVAALEGAYSTAKVKRSKLVFAQNVQQLQQYLEHFRQI